MSWNPAPDVHFFRGGDAARIELRFFAVPFSINRDDVHAVFQSVSGFSVTEIREGYESIVPFVNVWYVVGRVTVPQTVGDLHANTVRVVNNLARAWSASIGAIDSWDASLGDFLPGPSTQTAVSMASLAVLALVVFFILKGTVL